MPLTAEPSLFGKVLYKATSSSFVENELDYIFMSHSNLRGSRHFNKSEIEDCKIVSIDSLYADCLNNEEKYTPWFRKIMNLKIF